MERVVQPTDYEVRSVFVWDLGGTVSHEGREEVRACSLWRPL